MPIWLTTVPATINCTYPQNSVNEYHNELRNLVILEKDIFDMRQCGPSLRAQRGRMTMPSHNVVVYVKLSGVKFHTIATCAS